MKAYWVKSPKWLSYIFKKRIWHINTKKKVLYLTFDDGPTTITPFVIKELQKYNAKATFFCIGENIKKHPKIFALLKANNHVIGNHTQKHINGWKTTPNEYLTQVIETEKIIYPHSHNMKSLKLFRPPFGKCTKAQRQLIYDRGYQIIMWSVLSADFDASITKEKCLKNVLKNARNGSIIVFHDSKKASAKLRYVLPKVLAYFHAKHYQFKGIDSLKQ